MGEAAIALNQINNRSEAEAEVQDLEVSITQGIDQIQDMHLRKRIVNQADKATIGKQSHQSAR